MAKKKAPTKKQLDEAQAAAGYGPKFVTKDFFGSVYLKDWLALEDSKSFNVVVGQISIVKDTDLLGFEVSARESNWCARVSSKSGEHVLTILGCQIRAVSTNPKFSPLKMGSNVYVVGTNP